jgi:hypothetical protein
MSENSYCSLVTRPNKSNIGLSRCEDRDDQICPVQEPDMFGNTYWNPTMDPNKSRGLRNSEWPRYVRVGGWICPTKLSRTRSGDRICTRVF